MIEEALNNNVVTGEMGLMIAAMQLAYRDAKKHDPTAALWLMGKQVKRVCEVTGYDHKNIARTVGELVMER